MELDGKEARPTNRRLQMVVARVDGAGAGTSGKCSGLPQALTCVSVREAAARPGHPLLGDLCDGR